MLSRNKLSVLILLSIALFYFFGLQGVLSLWIIPIIAVVGFFFVIALWKIFKYVFLSGIVIVALITFAVVFLRIAMLFWLHPIYNMQHIICWWNHILQPTRDTVGVSFLFDTDNVNQANIFNCQIVLHCKHQSFMLCIDLHNNSFQTLNVPLIEYMNDTFLWSIHIHQ